MHHDGSTPSRRLPRVRPVKHQGHWGGFEMNTITIRCTNDGLADVPADFFADCPYCEGDGCIECDGTGEYI